MSDRRTARDETLAVLQQREVRHIFGNPGTTELDLISALPPEIDYVLCLQEAIAVGAATGYALMGNLPGVVSLHALPGLGHAMGALHGARLMHAPVVALVGQQHSHHLRAEPLLSGDLVATAGPATRWAHQPARAEDVPSAVERAFRVATSPPMGPAMVAIPMDFWDQPAGPAIVARTPPAPRVPAAHVDHVHSLLQSCRAGALITGDRINDEPAWDAAVAIADQFDLRVFAAPIGTQPGFPTGHSRFEGTLPLGATAINRRLAEFDLVVVVGAPVFTLYLHDGSIRPGAGTEIVLVTDEYDEAARAPVEMVALGDPGAFLVALAAGETGSSPTSPGARTPATAASGLDLGSVMAVVASWVPDDTLFIDESMTAGGVVRSYLGVNAPRQYLRTSTGVLGTGLSAALGTALARPDRHVVAIVGDGSVMFSPQALWTAGRLGLRLTVLVLNNGGYESLRGYEKAHLGHLSPRPGAFDLVGIDLPALALALGVAGLSVIDPAGLRVALGDALGTDGPTLIDIRLD